MWGSFGWGTLAASSLIAGGWNKGRILVMWTAIAITSGVASMAGYGLFQNSSPNTVAFVLTSRPAPS